MWNRPLWKNFHKVGYPGPSDLIFRDSPSLWDSKQNHEFKIKSILRQVFARATELLLHFSQELGPVCSFKPDRSLIYMGSFLWKTQNTRACVCWVIFTPSSKHGDWVGVGPALPKFLGAYTLVCAVSPCPDVGHLEKRVDCGLWIPAEDLVRQLLAGQWTPNRRIWEE